MVTKVILYLLLAVIALCLLAELVFGSEDADYNGMGASDA